MTDPYPPGGRPENTPATPTGDQAPGTDPNLTDRTQAIPGTPTSGAPAPQPGTPDASPANGPAPDGQTPGAPNPAAPTSGPAPAPTPGWALGAPTPGPAAPAPASGAPASGWASDGPLASGSGSPAQGSPVQGSPAAGTDGAAFGWPTPAPAQPGPDAAGQPGPYPGAPSQPGGYPGQAEPPTTPGGYPGQPGGYAEPAPEPAGYASQPGADHTGTYAGQPGQYPGQPAQYPGQPGVEPLGQYPGQPGVDQPGQYPGQPGPDQVGQYPGQPGVDPAGQYAGPGGEVGGPYPGQPGGEPGGQPGAPQQQWAAGGPEQPTGSAWPAQNAWSPTPPGGPGGWAPPAQQPGRKVTVALVLACVLLAVAVVQTALLVHTSSSLSDQKKAQAAAQARDEKRLKALEGTVKALEGSSLDAAAVAKKVLPSVFQVVAGDYTGSSFVVGAAPGGGSYLLTNDHVVQPLLDSGSKTVKLERDGGTFSATVVQHDEALDVAVLQSDQKFDKLNRVSKPVSPGDPVIVIGAPLGLNDTVTTGVVSSAQRDVPGSSEKFIQFDAAINPGNSGGPVMNAKGEVVGIATEKARDAEGIGLAIPISVPCDKFSVCK
ncbi:MAG TPA: trypsin-like peptidase domain-containing protein [Actinocatenispora sp.]